MKTHIPTKRIFAWPLIFGALSLSGLVLGLTGDGWRDVASWLFLGVVPAAIAARWLRRNSNTNPKSTNLKDSQ